MDSTPPDRWVRHPLAGLARMVVAILAGLVSWTILPVALGWQPTVVLSGSMQPAIRVGDVVLTREVPVDDLQPGHVLLVRDPTRPDHLLLHRYDHLDDDGGLVLRGDANQAEDSSPVRPADVNGVGVLRVPWVGLPYVWLGEGRYAAVGLSVLALLALLALSPVRERVTLSSNAVGAPDHHHSDPRHAAVAGVVLLLMAGSTAGSATAPASAAFVDSTSMSATFTTGSWATDGRTSPAE